MTSIARDPSDIPSEREAAVAKNPCPFQAGIVKSFPGVKVTPKGIEIASFVSEIRSVNVSNGICKILTKALTDASKANGGDGLHFTSEDIRATAFFDGLTTGIFRNGFNRTRFTELMGVTTASDIGAADIARIVRAVANEQAANLKAIGFTLFEHSAIRHLLAGFERVAKSDLEALFSQGTFTSHFLHPYKPKTLPRVIWNTMASAAHYGAQAAMNFISNANNADLPTLKPLPPAAVTAGAAAATEPPKRKCPFH